MTDLEVYSQAAALGVVAGMRTMSAPALVSRVAKKGQLAVEGSNLAFLNSTGAVSTTALLALGELIADKLPATPARTEVGPLVARAVSGGVSGAVICSARKKSPWVGALLGAAAAVGATFAAYHLRRAAKEKLHIPDTIVALAEDALVAGGGFYISSHLAKSAV